MRGGRRLSASVAAAVCTLVVAGSADALAAPPSNPAPSAAATSATPGPSPSTPTLPAATADPDVVILHTDTTAGARSAVLRNGLDRLGASVRHVFSGQQAVSVQLPAGTPASRVADLPGVAHVEKPVVRTLAGVPDDPRLPTQRAYLDAVHAPAAWNRQQGSADVRIAVIDTGIDVRHPDLAGKVVGTYNAVTGSSSITDTVGHGTFVAGVAGAATDNHIGVAGAGYDTSILGVKVVDRYGDITIDDEVAGIRWAADHGADIINLSLSGPDASASERRAVEYAQGKGVLVVAAAGNDGDTVKQYPAAYADVVAVGATDVARHRRASFSSYGPWVTLAAPGVDLASTTPLAGSDYFATRTGYALGDGTSFSSPLVAGAAALLKAQNPALTAAMLRSALVSSASGYDGSGLGRGQIDFDLALQHVAPVTVPTTALATGVTGSIGFSALSSAPRVGFRVDGGPLLGTAPVAANRATFAFASYGYLNGTHQLTAVACTAYAECAASGMTVPFIVHNAAPTLGSPAAADTVSGVFHATANGPGGGARLFVDDHAVAFDSAAPYDFTVNASAWTDGTHTLQVQTCTASQSRCDGPRTAARSVVFDSLHPQITALSRTRISPNGDHSGDSATVTFTLPEAQNVSVETIDADGDLIRSDVLGPLRAGRHTWIWRGLGRGSARLPDGSYQLALVTSRTANGVTRKGQAGRTATVDTVAPRLSGLQGRGVHVYPARDGYRDTFTPSTKLPDGGRLVLTVRSSTGHLVRVLATSHAPAARVGIVWNGRTSGGTVVRAGKYRWTFTVSDRAGNVRRTAWHNVYVSAKQLRARMGLSLRAASVSVDAGGTARCATTKRSAYAHGRLFVNNCPTGSEEVTYARYAFRVPSAYRYLRLSLAAFGRTNRASELSASFQRADGGLEVPRSVRVAAAKRGAWHSISGVPASGHVSHRTVLVTLILSSRYAGANDFDVRSVRLRAHYQVLA